MKNPIRVRLLATSIAVAAFPAFGWAESQPAHTPGYNEPMQSASASSLRVVPKDESVRTVDQLAGRKLRDTRGDQLGTVKDFLVDPTSGEVKFAVVSSGGFAGVGDTLHLVSFRSLNADAAKKDFTTDMTKETLNQAPVVKEEQFEENTITRAAAASSRGVAANESDRSATLLRATKLDGRAVKANGEKIGEIKGLFVEPGASQAMALLEPSHRIGANDEKFLVPLNQLAIAGKGGRDITTQLSPADFQQAAQFGRTASAGTTAKQSGNASDLSMRQSQNVAADASAGTAAPAALGATSSQSPMASAAETTAGNRDVAQTESQGGQSTAMTHTPGGWVTTPPADVNGAASPMGANERATHPAEALTPTGHTSSEQTPMADPKLITAAHSIREALDNDPTTAHADVRVVPENGKISLEGKVNTESQKTSIESKARQAANGCPIDSQLKVDLR